MRMPFPSAGHDVGFLYDVPGVVAVDHNDTATTVVADGPAAIPVAAALANHDVHPPDFRTHHPSLEDVFLTTTGRSLRD